MYLYTHTISYHSIGFPEIYHHILNHAYGAFACRNACAWFDLEVENPRWALFIPSIPFNLRSIAKQEPFHNSFSFEKHQWQSHRIQGKGHNLLVLVLHHFCRYLPYVHTFFFLLYCSHGEHHTYIILRISCSVQLPCRSSAYLFSLSLNEDGWRDLLKDR